MKQENRRKNAKIPSIPSFGAQFLRFYHKNKNEGQTFKHFREHHHSSVVPNSYCKVKKKMNKETRKTAKKSPTSEKAGETPEVHVSNNKSECDAE